MKKYLKRAFCIWLVFALCFAAAGCGGGGGDGDGENAEGVSKTFMIMGTGGVSGTWYSVGGVIAAQLSKSPMLSVTAQTAAGGVESIRLVSKNERQLGFAMPNLALYAEEGIESFEGEKIENIRAICLFMPMEAHFIVRKDSGINTIADIRGKAIGTGAPGSGDEVMCRELLKAVGITYDDCTPMMLSFSEQVTAFKDRQIDVMFMLASSPTSAVLDAASQADVKLLPIDGTFRDEILEVFPYYGKATIPAEKYTFLSEDVETIGIGTMLFTNAEMPNDVVYELCQTMFDNIDPIQKAHNSMASFSLDTAIEGLTVKLHPGAEQFYKDNGVL